MTPKELRAHLRLLLWRGKLHQRLRGHDEGSPWPEVLFFLHLVFYAAAAIHLWRFAQADAESGNLSQDDGVGWFIALLLCGVALRIGWPLARSPEQRIKARLRADGVLVPAIVVQANGAYFDPSHRAPCPGSLLISFDPRAEADAASLAYACNRLRELKRADRSLLPRSHADLGWRLYHEMVDIPAYPVPDELTDGLKDCWLVGSWFARDDYGEQHADGKRLWVLALRGADSRHAFAPIPRALLEYPTPSWIAAIFWRWCVPRGVR